MYVKNFVFRISRVVCFYFFSFYFCVKSRIQTLENMVEEDQQKTIQLELLKQEKSKLISQLTAQESVIDGLKAERKIWGEELAQQGNYSFILYLILLEASRFIFVPNSL